MLPNVGWFEMMMLMGVAVLLFGKRLPEVGRSLGKGIVEFKKGLSGAVDEFDISGTGPADLRGRRARRRVQPMKPSADSTYTDASVPKFELPGTASSPCFSAGDGSIQPAPRD